MNHFIAVLMINLSENFYKNKDLGLNAEEL